MKKKKTGQQQRRTSTSNEKKKNKGTCRNSNSNNKNSINSIIASTSVEVKAGDEIDLPSSLETLSVAADPSLSSTVETQTQTHTYNGIEYKNELYADAARILKTCQKELTTPTTTTKSSSPSTTCTEPEPEQQQQKKEVKCYHGSSQEAYTNPKYIKAFTSIMEPNVFMQNYKNRRLLKDPQFCTYVFARAVDTWLVYKLDEKEDDEVGSNIHLNMVTILSMVALSSRYNAIPISQGIQHDLGSPEQEKFSKYQRDLTEKRGIINVLSRETGVNSGGGGCNCMEKSKQDAKTMEKVGRCHGCLEKFPKNQLRLCTHCKGVKYCSRKCQIAEWPNHKVGCQETFKNQDWGSTSQQNLMKELTGQV